MLSVGVLKYFLGQIWCMPLVAVFVIILSCPNCPITGLTITFTKVKQPHHIFFLEKLEMLHCSSDSHVYLYLYRIL